jgi:hypothetical protein
VASSTLFTKSTNTEEKLQAMENKTSINCPHCGEPVNVNDALYQQLENEIKRKYYERLAADRKRHESEMEALKLSREQLESEKKKLSEQIEEGVKTRLTAEKVVLEKQIKNRIEAEESEKFKVLQEELNEKSAKLKEFNQAKAEIERLKREKEEIRDSILAETEKAMNHKLNEEKERIKKAESDRFEFTRLEYEKKLADQMKLVEEMRRKSEQGSMQLQGEVQELAIEEWLKESFPLDTISEIKKGAIGGDCVQTVNTYTRQNCGRIYYESKCTKTFRSDWIDKFKSDMRARGIDIGTLVKPCEP